MCKSEKSKIKRGIIFCPWPRCSFPIHIVRKRLTATIMMVSRKQLIILLDSRGEVLALPLIHSTLQAIGYQYCGGLPQIEKPLNSDWRKDHVNGKGESQKCIKLNNCATEYPPRSGSTLRSWDKRTQYRNRSDRHNLISQNPHFDPTMIMTHPV